MPMHEYKTYSYIMYREIIEENKRREEEKKQKEEQEAKNKQAQRVDDKGQQKQVNQQPIMPSSRITDRDIEELLEEEGLI